MIWIVRDTSEEDGTPMNYVSVWRAKPKRTPMGTGHVWVDARWPGDVGDPFSDWIGSLWLADANRMFGTVPDDGRQVIAADHDIDRIRAAIEKAGGGRRAR